MRTENEFNQHLREKFNKLSEYVAFKVSDRFYVGAADWLVFSMGKAIAIECKFIKRIGQKGNLLKHPLTGPQRTYMKRLWEAGVPGWVLVGVGEEHKMYLIYNDLLGSGNIAVEDFKRNLEEGMITCYPLNDIRWLLDGLFES